MAWKARLLGPVAQGLFLPRLLCSGRVMEGGCEA